VFFVFFVVDPGIGLPRKTRKERRKRD